MIVTAGKRADKAYRAVAATVRYNAQHPNQGQFK
jgi:hypothetical protein